MITKQEQLIYTNSFDQLDKASTAYGKEISAEKTKVTTN